MTGGPLLGARGEVLAPSAVVQAEERRDVPISRPQLTPFPQLAGLTLQRVRPAMHGAPEASRLTLVLLCELSGKGRGLVVDFPMTLRGRPLADMLRAMAQQVDAIVDHYELATDDQTEQAAGVRPASAGTPAQDAQGEAPAQAANT